MPGQPDLRAPAVLIHCHAVAQALGVAVTRQDNAATLESDHPDARRTGVPADGGPRYQTQERA